MGVCASSRAAITHNLKKIPTMYQFLFGVITGGILFGSDDNKESDAEYRARTIKEDRKRASATLARKPLNSPPLIEGTVTKVELSKGSPWQSPAKIATVGDWCMRLDPATEITVGSVIKVISHHRVQINGQWHNFSGRVPSGIWMLCFLLALAGMSIAGWALWNATELSWQAIRALTGSTTAPSLTSAAYAFVYLAIGFGILGVALDLGKPANSLWKHTAC